MAFIGHAPRPVSLPFAMPRKTKDKPQSKSRPAKNEGRLKNIVSGCLFMILLSFSKTVCRSYSRLLESRYCNHSTCGYTPLQFGKKRHEVSPLFDFNEPLQEAFRREFAYVSSVCVHVHYTCDMQEARW